MERDFRRIANSIRGAERAINEDFRRVAECTRTKTQHYQENKGDQEGFDKPLSGSAGSTKLAKLPNMPTFYPDFKNQHCHPRKQNQSMH
ncbi:hypothetical protein H5410_003797 [Solanum commersonii]|uniref:Uncharacterized protein n=1 Tax=Solanum commersonii TaxID=4109 RepID=A0A9J6B5Z9_SOLCO|nr:hypothetical protein H5410_003797 [Solanum commersonii]